jgi:LruC domain-containing protein
LLFLPKLKKIPTNTLVLFEKFDFHGIHNYEVREMKILFFILVLINCADNHPNREWLNEITAFTNTNPFNDNPNSPNIPTMPSTPPITQGNLNFTLYQFSGNNPTFLFDNTRQITFGMFVYYDGINTSNAEVTFGTLDGGFGVFRALTDENGDLKGNFIIDPILNQLRVKVKYQNYEVDAILDVKNGIVNSTNGTIIANINQVPLDSDGDGIRDSDDHYPNDPDRATKINYPTEGFYTVAFEDLYPKQGDADFNDYVVRVRYEEDLNQKGEVKRVRGYFQHVAKGAGYNHILKLTLPNALKAKYNLKNFTSTDILESEFNFESVSPSSIALFSQSNLTIGKSNTSKNQTFEIGKKAEIEFVLETPISKSELGSVPYDIFISVLNTNQEIHFAGKKFDPAGKDLYLDQTGFPWAIMVPGNFKWPYERTNIHTAYSKFESWYKSLGQVDTDWYNFSDAEKVFLSE